MKKLTINPNYLKQITRILILSFCIFCISFSLSYSQLTITPGSGHTTLCKGDIDTYTLDNPMFGVTYNWYVDPPGVATINNTSQNQVTVLWHEGDFPTTSYTLHVSGGGNFGSITIQVYDIPEPYITFTNEVTCMQTILRENTQGNQILDDEDGTINVCENAEVVYTANGWVYGSPLGLCKFDWYVIGGLIVATDGTTLLTPVSFVNGAYGSTPQEVTVQWGNTGSGSIKLTETTIFNTPSRCPPKSKIVDLNIIDSPVADFLIDNTIVGSDECYDICKNQSVSFKSTSTASHSSPLNSCIWNFGDNTPVSHLINPTHTFTDPGIFEVTLTVINICNCTSTMMREVCVDELEGPNIFCPSAVCENSSELYHTDAICDPYVWNAIGGTATSLANPAYVEVKWDNVGLDGYGYLSINGSDCHNSCPAIITVKVPVILASGTIDGPTTTCSNTHYIFELPDWPATNFEWSLVNNNNLAIFSSYSQNSYWVVIETGDVLLPFTLVCEYHNTISDPSCSGRAELTVDVKPRPEIIGPEEICISTVCTCEVTIPPPSSGIINWIVTKPDGTVQPVQQSLGSNPVILPDYYFDISGTYSIRASSPANFCDPKPFLLEVVDPPLTPTHIYGDDNVCLNYPYTYSTDVIKNSITIWTVTGGTITGSSIGNSVTVIWNPTSTKTISAYREWEDISGCISGVYQKDISQIIVNGFIIGDDEVCQDQSYSYEINLNGVLGETYNWNLLSSGNVGSISPGQAPFQCSVTFLYLATTADVPCILTCDVTKCGIIETISYPITIEPNTIITSLTANPTTVCSGNDVGFEALFSGATPDSFIWDFGDGTIPSPACTTNSCTHPFTNTGNGYLFFTVSVQAVSGCNGAVSDAVTVVITVKPEPNAYLWPGDFVLFKPPMGTYDLHVTVTSTGTFTYQWYYDDGNSSGNGYQINGATSASYTVNSTPPDISPYTTPTSEGEYWCMVTSDQTGCDTKTNIKYIYEDPYHIPLSCTPLGQYGIDYGIENFNITLTGCGQVQATCTTYGSYPGNIIGYNWSVDPGVATYTYSGTEAQNNSKFYTFSQTGMYKIGLDVYYLNSIPNNPACTLSIFKYIIVPLVAELQWSLVCNSANDKYDLILEDFSSVFPGFPVTQWQWKINGNSVGSSLPTHTETVTAGTTYTVELIVKNSTMYPCTTSVQIDIPALPVAGYTAVTTYNGNPSNPYKSCEGRAIEFTNTSSPINNIIFHEWSFEDGTESHMVNPIKVYDVGTGQANFHPELTVTDKQGCTNTISKTITVYNNDLDFIDPFPGNQYLPPSSELCFNAVLNPDVEPLFTGGSGNLSYKWYMGTNLLSFTCSTLTGPIIESGAYWVKITDENYCYKEINPMPALISIKYSPTTIIDGKQDICYGDDIKLKAVTGFPACSTLTYNWTCVSGGLSGSTNKEIIIPGSLLNPGIYLFTLEVEDPVTGCSSTSQPFDVTVHSNPSPPLLAMDIIDCDLYEIELTGATSAPPTPAFTWSNGTNGLTTIVNHGGVYRLWITDVYGCRNYADIEVPLAPDYYFWRFPLGCYYYCEEDLQKWVDGPMFVDFEQWIWSKNGKVISKNTLNGIPYAGSGVHSACDPLTIDVNPNGEGPGDYAWGLNNGLCYMKSGIMMWILLDCCDAEIVIDTIYCVDNIYHFTLEVFQSTCKSPSYNLAVVNGLGISVVPTINNLTPATLNNGITVIHGDFPVIPGVSNVIFKIKVNCVPPCTAETNVINLPLCSKSVLQTPAQDKDRENESTSVAVLDIIPNPATSQTNIHYRFPETVNINTSEREMKIFDTMGRPVTTIQLNDVKGVYVLDLNQYSAGIYFVELNNNNRRIITRRMIIYH